MDNPDPTFGIRRGSVSPNRDPMKAQRDTETDTLDTPKMRQGETGTTQVQTWMAHSPSKKERRKQKELALDTRRHRLPGKGALAAATTLLRLGGRSGDSREWPGEGGR